LSRHPHLPADDLAIKAPAAATSVVSSSYQAKRSELIAQVSFPFSPGDDCALHQTARVASLATGADSSVQGTKMQRYRS